MPAKLQTSELFDVIAECSLVNDDLLSELREEFQSSADSIEVAKSLVRAGHISKWQAEHLLAGRACPRYGKYRLIDEIDGNARRVYLAEHTQMMRHVILKSLGIKDTSSGSQSRYLSRARDIAALDHPHIVHVFDFDCDPNHGYFLVMEKIAGTALTEVLFKHRLPADEAVRYILQAATALNYACGLRVHHGQLGTTQLLISADDQVKLLGMGLYYFDKPSAIGEEEAEVLRRADMLSLASLLQAMIVGERPSARSASRIPRPIAEFLAKVRRENSPIRTWNEFDTELRAAGSSSGDPRPRTSAGDDGLENTPNSPVPPPRAKRLIPISLLVGGIGAVVVSIAGIIALVLVLRMQHPSADQSGLADARTHDSEHVTSDELNSAAIDNNTNAADVLIDVVTAADQHIHGSFEAEEPDDTDQQLQIESRKAMLEKPISSTNESEPDSEVDELEQESQPESERTGPKRPPFESFPEIWPLPDARNTSITAVGPLFKTDHNRLKVRLIGGDQAFRGALTFQIASDPSQPAWDIQVADRSKSSNIARLAIQDDQLTFQWLQSGVDSPSSNYLRNCLLELSARGHTLRLRLRKPIELAPFAINFMDLTPRQSLDAAWLPRPDTISLTVSAEGNFNQPAFHPANTVPADRGVIDVTAIADRFPLLAFRVETRLRSRPQILFTAAYRITEGDQHPKPFGRNTLRQLTAQAIAAESQRAQLQAQLEAAPRGGDDNRKQRLAKRRRELAEQQLALLTAGIERLQALRGTCEVLNNQAAIHFQIFSKIDGEQVIIAQSSKMQEANE